MKKMIYIIIGIFILFVTVAFFSSKSVHSEIVINASKDKVWDVLVSTKEYPKWNPIMKVLEGNLKKGNKLTYEFRQSETSKKEIIRANVKELISNKLLRQKGGIPLVITFNHSYTLKEVNGKTQVNIDEKYNGFYVLFWNPNSVEKAYIKLNKSLKKRVESLK